MAPTRARKARPSAPFFASLVLLPVLLEGCGLGLSQEDKPAKEYRGYYSINLPGTRGYMDLDSSCRITWIPTGASDGGEVAISLHSPSGVAYPVDTVPTSDGEYLWSIPSTMASSGYALIAASGYRIRVTSLADTSKWDWSDYFNLGTDRYGTFSLQRGVDSLDVLRGDTLAIRWMANGNLGDSLGLLVRRHGQPVSELIKVATRDTLYRWAPSDSLEPGAGYSILMFSLSYPLLRTSIPKIRIHAGFEGAFAFTTPGPGSTLFFYQGIGSQPAWKATGLPGRSVSLSLACDNTYPPFLHIEDSLPISGSHTWTVPVGFATNSQCRFHVASEQDTSLNAYSPYFSIQGLQRDIFEADDSLPAARVLNPGLPQARTLTWGDQDWIRFNVRQGKQYLIAAGGKDTLNYLLLRGEGDTLARRSDSTVRILAASGADGTWHLRVGPGKKTGAYSLRLAEYDTNSAAFQSTFTTPSSAGTTQWTAGAAVTIRWTPDTLLFGNRVLISLYKGNTFVGGQGGAGIPNTGTFMATAPIGFYTASDFRYRLTSTLDTGIHVFSEFFRVAGMQPDAYEPDNASTAAKPITEADGVQQHNLAWNDTDWVMIGTVEGKSHHLEFNAVFECRLETLDSTGAVVHSFRGRSGTLILPAASEGAHRVRIVPETAYGNYTLSLSLKDP